MFAFVYWKKIISKALLQCLVELTTMFESEMIDFLGGHIDI